MPQTFLALGAILLLSTFALNQQQHAAGLDRGAERREVDLAATDLARAWLAAAAERVYDESDVGRTGLRLDTDGLTAPEDLGPEPGEVNLSTFDDADDYHGFTTADSVLWDGSALLFDVDIAVRYVLLDTPDTPAGSPTLAKEIAVTVSEQATGSLGRRPVQCTLRAVVSPAGL